MGTDDVVKLTPGESGPITAGSDRLGVETQNDPEHEAAFATSLWAKEADQRMGKLEGRADVVDTRLDKIDGQVKDARGDITKLQAGGSVVVQQVNATKTRVGDVNQRITDTNRTISGHVATMNRRLGEVDNRITQVTQRLDAGRIEGPNATRQAHIDALVRIRDSLPADSHDRVGLASSIHDMQNARTDAEFTRAQDSASGHVHQLESSRQTERLANTANTQARALATEAHAVGNKTAKWIGLAAIPGLLALIPSSIIAANNQTDRNKTVAGDNNG